MNALAIIARHLVVTDPDEVPLGFIWGRLSAATTVKHLLDTCHELRREGHAQKFIHAMRVSTSENLSEILRYSPDYFMGKLSKVEASRASFAQRMGFRFPMGSIPFYEEWRYLDEDMGFASDYEEYMDED